MKLSAVLCIHNEQDRLPGCLAKLEFADEIVIVLDRCTDRSKSIAIEHDAVIVEGVFPLEGDRRNAGIETAAGDWILELDADEIVPEALATEIVATIDESDADYHAIPFDNYVGQRLVKYGWGASFGVSSVVRLTRNGVKSWGFERVHPKITLKGTRGEPLHKAIIHHVDRDLTDMIRRLNSYSSARAADLREAWLKKEKLETLRHNLLRFFGRFYKCFVRRKGYREGLMGFAIALMAGLYPILSYLKAHLDRDD
ncbi:MAG: glycosyltransferase family 2 protein [Pseudomonadota bacterium]|nr:glycosyltransferase family 2 protein [Pseudomonadota bacterium]